MHILSAALAGALAGFILRYFLDGYTVHGVGWIERTLGEKFSSAWFWAMVGAVLAGGAEALRWAWRKDQADALRQWAQRRQFEYRENRQNPDRDYQLEAFRKSIELRNQLTGRIDDRPFEMVDVTTQRRDSEGSKTVGHHTVAILCDSEPRLPAFTLQPYGVGRWVWEWLGTNRIQISGEHLAPYEARVVARFNRKYSLQTRVSQSASLDSLRETLTMQVLQFLVEHPGWYIESRGGQLAIWKPGRIISASRRDNLLGTIQELDRRLHTHQVGAPGRGLEFSHVTTSPQALARNMLGAAIGGIVGFFTGGFIGMWLFFSLAERLAHAAAPMMFASFFAPILVFLAVGALVGARIARMKGEFQ